MVNPYDGIDLDTVNRINSVSHQHLSHNQNNPGLTQSNFDELYATGARHFAISRYRPSIITYPFDYENHSFDYVANPFGSTLPLAELKREYARTVTFANADDVIASPNAEHTYPLLLYNGAWSKWSSVHINGIGSYYQSGLVPDQTTGYQNAGAGLPYSQVLKNILRNLQYGDGGGVIINHPTWTEENKHFDFDLVRFICDCLDFDSRVLGTDMIEYIESGGHVQDAITTNTSIIDAILSTGRRCWIFCIGDWGTTYGRNELLIPSGVTGKANLEHECLKAYRDGRFFSRYRNTNLSITSVEFVNGLFTISADHADAIQIISDGETTTYTGSTASQQINESAKYVRAVAYTNPVEGETPSGDLYNDIVFTNPIMINPIEYPYRPAYDIVQQKDRKRFNMVLWG